MESFDEILQTTRSVRRRIDFDRPLEAEVLHACIANAVQAPTGLNRESWRFLIVTEAEPKQALGRLYREAFDELTKQRFAELRRQGITPPSLSPNYRFLADRLEAFPALILVCSEGRPEPGFAAELGYYGSILPAAWSLMLSLRARQIGSTWTSLLAARAAPLRSALSIPDDVTPTVLLPAGYLKNARLRPADRRPPEQVTFWNAWGNPGPHSAK